MRPEAQAPLLAVSYPKGETVAEYVEGFVMTGLLDLLAGRGKPFTTDTLHHSFRRRMAELFAESTALGILRDAPANSLDALPTETLEQFGQRCWAMTLVMANDVVGEGALCGTHSSKL